MSLKASEQIKALHSIIGALLEHVGVLDNAKQNAAAAETQLAATLSEYETAVKRLEAVRAELAKAEADLKNKRHLIHNEAACSLAEINHQIAARQAELAALKNNSKEKL